MEVTSRHRVPLVLGIHFILFYFLQASKVFITGKQIAPRTLGRGRRAPLSTVLQGFLSLKDGGYQHGVHKRCGFLPLVLPSYLYQSLFNRGLRGGNVP